MDHTAPCFPCCALNPAYIIKHIYALQWTVTSRYNICTAEYLDLTMKGPNSSKASHQLVSCNNSTPSGAIYAHVLVLERINMVLPNHCRAWCLFGRWHAVRCLSFISRRWIQWTIWGTQFPVSPHCSLNLAYSIEHICALQWTVTRRCNIYIADYLEFTMKGHRISHFAKAFSS
jgi:hypothetical protein